MEILALVEAGLAADRRVVADLEADQWHRPTPCDPMDVGAVVEHLVGALGQMADVAEGKPFDPTAGPTLVAGEAGPALEAAGARLVGLWGSPGALDASYEMPFGSVPGRDLARFTVLEVVVHGWDLATATDRTLPLGDAEAEAVLAVAEGFAPETLRAPGMFGPPAPVDAEAPALERLVAFCGRRV